MKKQARINRIIIACSAAFLLWSIGEVEENGPLIQREALTEDRDTSPPIVNTTTIADAVFLDEWVSGLRLEGTMYKKQVVDQTAFAPYRPRSYSIQEDPFSVSKVTFRPRGSGIRLVVETPMQFTHMTLEGFKNALATAGVTDAEITLLSPAKTSGLNALSGVFPYFVQNTDDRTRMNLAQEEMRWLVYLTDNYHVDVTTPKRLNAALADTKHSLTKYHKRAWKGTIKQVLQTRWQRYGLLPLTKEDETKLVEWMDAYQRSEAISDSATNRLLEKLYKEVQEEGEERGEKG